MNWLGLVAGWIVVFRPAALAAFATAVPILWNSDPGFDVAMPTFCALADVASVAPKNTAAAVSSVFMVVLPNVVLFWVRIPIIENKLTLRSGSGISSQRFREDVC
jgi:hypothetical protein